MNYLLAENVSKSFGEKTLFSALTLGLDSDQKMALIARNGAGKSSLLNILAGKDSPDTGFVTTRRDLRMAYLPQNPALEENLTVIQSLFFEDNEMTVAIAIYEQCLSDLRTDDSPQQHKKLDEAISRMDALGAWDYESKVKEVLTRLKIDDLRQPVSQLSGGQRKKVALARVLITESDLLILDEPTNHLDIEMIEWLEEYLSRPNLCLLLVTHDRYFLDNVCNVIVELDESRLFWYRGNYTRYLEKKAERELVERQGIEKARNLYEKELEWIRRMPSARGTKAKARVEAFDEIREKAFRPIREEKSDLRVMMQRLGGKILELNNIDKSFGDLRVLDDFSYTFKKGERIGLVGKNGVGKSTFLNLITGSLRPDKGKITAGTNTVFGYYTQEGLEVEEGKRVIDIIRDIAEMIPLGKGQYISASQFLFHFNFSYTLQYNYFSNLSGGEKRRLYLLMTLMKNPNFLILDEPTNDLDVFTLQLLEDFLEKFEGCLMIVSHDRFFMDKLVDHIFVFEGEGKIKDFFGNYTQYHAWRAEKERLRKLGARLIREKTEPKKEKERSKPTYKQKVEFQSLEKEIESLEVEKGTLLERLNSGQGTPAELQEWSVRFGQVNATLEDRMDRWLELSDLMENPG